MSRRWIVVDKGWVVAILIGSFLWGWIWASAVKDKDVSQFGTQLQCTQQGDLQK